MAIELTSSQVGYIFERARADRRLTDSMIKAYLAELTGEIAALEERLRTLRSASTPTRTGAARKAAKPAARVAAKKGAKPSRNTAKNAASRKVQGQYIGFLRQIPKAKRGPFQKLAQEKGREQAITALRKALGK